jgi:hypothetical protein
MTLGYVYDIALLPPNFLLAWGMTLDEMTFGCMSDKVMMSEEMSVDMLEDPMTLDYMSLEDTALWQSRQASICQMQYLRGKIHPCPYQSLSILCM